MILYAGTTRDADGAERHVYSDRSEALPLRCQAFRQYLYDPCELPWSIIEQHIASIEAHGGRVTWRVGGRDYMTMPHATAPRCAECGHFSTPDGIQLHALACSRHEAATCYACGGTR